MREYLVYEKKDCEECKGRVCSCNEPGGHGWNPDCKDRYEYTEIPLSIALTHLLTNDAFVRTMMRERLGVK